MENTGIIAKYGKLINFPRHAASLSLAEGDTPLISIPRIAEELGGSFELFVKYEGLNPTGSFKDRGMVVAMSEAVGRGAKTVVCASTGNTAASAAAYAARAGVRAVVLIPEGKVARGKLVAAVMYGGQVVQVRGSFDDALKLVQAAAEKFPLAVVNSINPFRIEGQKTAAFEICDVLGRAPDMLCLPVGNAGNITAYYQGFAQYHKAKKTGTSALLGVQAMGASPLVVGKIFKNPDTMATAIRIGNPVRGREALEAAKKTKGKIIAVSDKKILNAQKMLAMEGIWVEPASASGLAGLIQEIRAGLNLKNKRVVIVCTGHGLKDLDVVEMPKTLKIKPDISELAKILSA